MLASRVIKGRIDASFRVTPKRMASLVLGAMAGLGGAAHEAYAQSLPNGGHFVAGSGAISGNGTSLTVNQSSPRAVIDWNSFSIGYGNRVAFANGHGATLNRVTGGDPSLILGMLSATGSVYLINPQGVVIGAGGVVSTGGRFVASTLDADNAAFMNGKPLTLTGNSSASVVNLGKIGSSGGDVFLISRNDVLNLGELAAPKGSVELAAGQKVLLQDSSTSRQVFVETGSRGAVTSLGSVQAAQISLQAADGNIYAFGGTHAPIRATGTATRDGHVWLVADQGAVTMAGTFTAKNANGAGGAVDTSAASFAPSFAGLTVNAGAWNVSLPSITVTQPIGAAIAGSLGAGTSVNLTTTRGNIEVASSVGWQGNASLMLGAYGSVIVDAGNAIRNQGAGNLTLRADASGIDNQGAVTNKGTLDWSGSTGTVRALYDMNGAYTPGTLLSNAAWTAAPGSALATQITAYKLVDSLADLKNVSSDLAGNYALGKNIEGKGSDDLFTPLGDSTTPFSGQFDGMGHSIDNIVMAAVYSGPDWPQALLPTGLFGVIGSAGIVRNLNLTNSQANAFNSAYTWSQVGLLAGINQGHIANVFASGGVSTGDEVQIGGLVGQNAGLIERSAANVSVGGLASYLGGLVGENDGTITQCYETGQINSQHPSLPGGLVGFNTGTISQSFAAGKLVGDGQVTPPAIAGYNTGTVAADNYWDVQKTGTSDGGGAPPSNGLTTAQMSRSASFVGWDFSAGGAWSMPAGATHPILKWQAASGSPLQ
jgi:filamentous hemagglutinin family protein